MREKEKLTLGLKTFHKHKWFPTKETYYYKYSGCTKKCKTPLFGDHYHTKDCKFLSFERKWVCECGKIKWVREEDE